MVCEPCECVTFLINFSENSEEWQDINPASVKTNATSMKTNAASMKTNATSVKTLFKIFLLLENSFVKKYLQKMRENGLMKQM